MKTRSSLGLLMIALVGASLGVFSHFQKPETAPALISKAKPPTSPAVVPDQRTLEATMPSEPRDVDAREVIGSCWSAGIPAEFAAFRDWSKRFLAAPAGARDALLAEGVELAKARRAVMARLISEDPELALALAVPMVVRQELPAEIAAQLEERVSGRGNLALMGVTPLEGQPVERSVFRTADIGSQHYEAFVYGRRSKQTTLLTPTSIIGVALDRKVAVSESPLRLLESGELAAGRQVSTICDVSGNSTATAANAPFNVAASTAVEYNGVVHVLCASAHVAELEAKLRSQERDHNETAFLDGDVEANDKVDDPVASDWTHGTKKVLIMRVDFSDKVGGATVDQVSNTMNGTNGVRDYYSSSSYGASTLLTTPSVSGVSPDITTTLRMPQTGAYYVSTSGYGGLMNDARTAATAAGYNLANYDLVGITFPSIGFGWSGLGYVGASGFWIQGGFSFYVVSHEIGHNYGLWHANRWKVTDGNPVSPTGASVEYGDPFDVMGGGGSYTAEFSQWNKSILQWIPASSITLGDNSGTYRVYRFDRVQTANLANPRALKVVRDATYDYWIGYRHASGNASLNGGAYIIWGYKYNKGGELLDMTTPGNTPADAGLAIGQTFVDAVGGISIKPLAQGGTGTDEYLDVQITYLPRVGWSQAVYSADALSGHAYVTVSRTKNSTGAIAVNYATANGTAVSPTNFTAKSGTLNWADGDMSDKVIDIILNTSPPAGGTTNFTVTLSGASGAAISGAAAATVNILGAGSRDPSFVAYYFSNGLKKVLPLADGSMLVGGTFTQVYPLPNLTAYNRSGVTRVSTTGIIDPTFAAAGGITSGTSTVINDLARQPDGKILAVGSFTGFNGSAGKNNIVRLLADGSLDSSFNAGTGANGIIYSVIAQPDGKILIGGAFTSFNGTAREYLARLNGNGSLDTTFVGPDFNGTTGGKVTSLALQPDGKLLVAGGFLNLAGTIGNLCRVTPTGALDATFTGLTTGTNAAINKVVLQPDGRILIVGGFITVNGTARGGLARLTALGAVDVTFVPPAVNGTCQTVMVQPDGSLLVGASGAAPHRLAHYSSTGTLDATFNASGEVTADVYDVALSANGRGIFAGNASVFQGGSYTCPLWQFATGLALPGSVQFSAASGSGIQGNSVNLSVTRTGGSLGALTVGYSTVPSAAHFTPTSGVLTWANGDSAAKIISVPLTLGTLSGATEACTVNLGQPVLGGALLGAAQQALITINPGVSPAIANDVNGDGKSDIILENTVNGTRGFWLMNGTGVGSWVLLSGVTTEWRIAASADFNADGKVDLVWENTLTGDRAIWLLNGTALASSVYLANLPVAWRIAGAADFNGDSKPDIVLENTLTGARGFWLMNGTAVGSWSFLAGVGVEWRIAATADFDADGKTDLLWENTLTGDRTFWLMNGTTLASSVFLTNVAPVWRIAGAADFNGDGKPDILWENAATGDRVFWLLNGTTFGSSVYLNNTSIDWRIAP